MKQFLIFIGVLMVSVVMFSCSDYNNPIAPETKNNLQMEALKLPTSNHALASETIFSASKNIDGTAGGTISFYFNYVSDDGHTVEVNGVLKIPAGAFDGNKTIDVIVDNEEAIIDFFPSPTVFNVPLLLNLDYSGLVLDQNAADFDFYFVDENDDNYELINKTAKDINVSLGKMGIVEAVIPHFSRFGFFR